MNRPALRACPLCAQREVLALHAMRFALPVGSSLPAAYDVAACARCDFVYADTPGSAHDYARHYTEHSRYEDPAVATGGGDRPADRARLAELADWIAARAPRSARVADIGCGNGGLLDALRARGFADLAGVDPAPGCVARLAERGYRAWQGSLAALPAAAAGFDLAILSHVLEHVLEPRAALASLRERLAPRGAVLVETPDASRYAGRRFVPFYFFDSEHINHFDAASLERLGALAGLGVADRKVGELRLENGQDYPVARVLLQGDAGAGTPPALAPLRRAVTAYIDESRHRSDDPALAALVASGRPLALWGAGSYAQRLLQGPALAGARFVAVVDRDRNKHGLEFAGCRIAAPESGLRNLPAGAVVLVAAALAADAIVGECRAMGLDCHVPGDGA